MTNDSPKDEPEQDKRPQRHCDVPTCGKPIGEFGHLCDYPGRPKGNE